MRPNFNYSHTSLVLHPSSALSMQHTLDLPTGYRLRIDSDILTLCRSDDSIVARFSAAGADLSEVRKAAEQDYSGTIYNHEALLPHTATGQPCLQVRFFGHFEILCNGEPVGLGRKGKALAILKYLLAHRERQVSRDHLMEWLWPKSSLKKARSSLNVALCTLRRLLSNCSAGLQNYILLEEGYYRLCPTVRVVTDVEEFDRRYQQGCLLEKTNRIEAAAEYEEAIEFYRGDYLLDDLYEDWTMIERERLSNAYVDMLERLALYYKQTEQLQESIRICYRILEKDRSHENSHLLLAEVYALLGSYGRALHQYRLLKGFLKSTHGTEPSVETEKRFENVLGRLGRSRRVP
jgi:LuxR family transcriptional regulator, maltose regulon positive regulatory protein